MTAPTEESDPTSTPQRQERSEQHTQTRFNRPPTSSNNWSKFPLLKIIIPPTGRLSLKTDERCFSYCSQSSKGRTLAQQPWCRSICIRRVFKYELENILSHHAFRNSFGNLRQLPLPPEGQPRMSTSESDEAQEKSYGKILRKQTRFWEAGWYLWFSKSHWAIQERLDLMSCSIEANATWLKCKEDMERERAQKLGEPVNFRWAGGELPIDPLSWSTAKTSDKSFMVKLPPPELPLENQMRLLYEPTEKLFTTFHDSFTSGNQRQLAGMLWETAKTGAPFILARNVLMQAWERFKDRSHKDD